LTSMTCAVSSIEMLKATWSSRRTKKVKRLTMQTKWSMTKAI
jgi:hypothetical protein